MTSAFSGAQEHVTQVIGQEPHEIIRISDAKSMCEGYNRGFAQAKGDLIIFCHDDIEFLIPDISQKLKRALAQFDVVGVAGTNRLVSAIWSAAGPAHTFGIVTHLVQGKFSLSLYAPPRRLTPNIQAPMDYFIACRREVASASLGCGNLHLVHLYDMDWTFRAFHKWGLNRGHPPIFPFFIIRTEICEQNMEIIFRRVSQKTWWVTQPGRGRAGSLCGDSFAAKKKRFWEIVDAVCSNLDPDV